jgi:nucleotide-binding universal stress UspA family protein
MKAAKAPTRRLRKSSAQVVVADASGHRVASAPAAQMAPVRFRIGRILVPMDFSEHSRKALRYARPFAEQFGAQITLLHIIEPVMLPTDFSYVPATPVDIDEKRMCDARKQLAGIAHELGATVPVDFIVRLGRSWKEIVDTAKTKHMDLLIIATHGYTGLKYALLGSVAEKIIRHAPCPVLVVRAEEHDFL